MSAIAYQLLSVHRRLDDEISHKMRARLPDVERIKRLKKLKLAIKDRLHALSLGTMRPPHVV